MSNISQNNIPEELSEFKVNKKIPKIKERFKSLILLSRIKKCIY